MGDIVKQLSNPIVVEDGQEDHDFLVATWPDGHRHEIPDITVGIYGQSKTTVAAKADTGLWKMMHEVTHNEVSLQQRCDRALLLSMFDQGRQVLQVRIDLFGKLPLPQPAQVSRKHEAVVRALAFMQPIAEQTGT